MLPKKPMWNTAAIPTSCAGGGLFLLLSVCLACWWSHYTFFQEEVNNLRKWVVTVVFFSISLHNYSVKPVHSSTCFLVLILHRWGVIRMQAHHMVILILVVTQMWMLNTWFVLFWHLPLSRCQVVSHVHRCVETEPVMLNLGHQVVMGAPGYKVFFSLSPLFVSPRAGPGFLRAALHQSSTQLVSKAAFC